MKTKVKKENKNIEIQGKLKKRKSMQNAKPKIFFIHRNENDGRNLVFKAY